MAEKEGHSTLILDQNKTSCIPFKDQGNVTCKKLENVHGSFTRYCDLNKHISTAKEYSYDGLNSTFKYSKCGCISGP